MKEFARCGTSLAADLVHLPDKLAGIHGVGGLYAAQPGQATCNKRNHENTKEGKLEKRQSKPAPPTRPPAASQIRELEVPVGQERLILVGDDETSIREVTRAILESNGYRVLLARNGSEAVALFQQHARDIQLVLTDMAMPVMDGTTTIRALRDLGATVPIVAGSGFCAGGEWKEVAHQVTCFLDKPYTTETFLRSLHQVLSQARK